MNLLPAIPDNAPFSPEQRAWLNGFLAGVFSRTNASGAPHPVASAPAPAPAAPLTILFGSQTGTAESLAKRAAKAAAARGFNATTLDMGKADATKLGALQNLLVITSTYGEGEPPDNAKALHAALAATADSPTATRFTGLRFSVCALGDTNYTQFCKCGRDFDAFLEKRGATRASPRVECDLEYEEKFAAWLDASLAALFAGNAPVAALPQSGPASPPVAPPESSAYSRKNPFPAAASIVVRLNGADSAKEVHHVEFSLAGSKLSYEPGDALGVIPTNDPELVTEVMNALGCDGEEAVTAPDGSPVSLRRALTDHYDLGKPTAELLALIPVPAGSDAPVDSGAPFHVIDAACVAQATKTAIAPADFVKKLRKIQPRLYSISSSPAAHPERVHLTVGAVRYEAAGRKRKGVCSTFLADRATAAGKLGIFIHTNPNFRLPADPETPVIMIGPGTGIAPFRGFLHHRRATGARGKNWLFFGDQHAATDFLYREELQAFQRDGYLHRLDLAWSRDEEKKVYVQHRMLEHAKEIWAWLEGGAHLYVCGDASRMAKDVDAALHKIVETAGFKSPEQAALYITGLRSARHYQRDVY